MCYQFSVFFFSCSKPVRLSLSYFFLIFFIISDNCMRSCTQTAAIAVAVAITVLLIILFACGVLTNKMCGITGKLLTLVYVERWWKTSSPASSSKYYKDTDVCRVFVFIAFFEIVLQQYWEQIMFTTRGRQSRASLRADQLPSDQSLLNHLNQFLFLIAEETWRFNRRTWCSRCFVAQNHLGTLS